jgi:hypothetical protein
MTSRITTSPSFSSHLSALVMGVTLLAPCHLAASGDTPTVETLTEGRRAVEEVYWGHRTWPSTDVAKPALSDVLPDADLRRQVDDSLRLSTALAERWRRPITRKDLQTEIDRMTRSTAAPDVLDELFAALGNDPRMVAECLVRPLLAQRLAREAYANDAELHAAVRTRAETAARNLHSAADLLRAGGRYTEVEWTCWDDDVSKRRRLGEDGAERRLVLDSDEWAELAGRLEGGTLGAGTGMIGPLREERDRFVVSAILERTPHRVKVASVSWDKRDFDAWWSIARTGFSPTVPEPAQDLRLAPKAVNDIPPNSWVDTTTAGSAPADRSRHTAVWTGSEMIVWGGTSGEGVFYGGSLYDPATDSWTAMTTTNHPDARADHTAVWDGSRMIVWGGWNGTLLATGGSYNPSTNSWTDTDTADAPAGRRYHTAVIDNSGDMLVWGGWDGSNYLGGACEIYDRSSDDWSTGNSAGAPSARMDHGAVFMTADNKMMVWGGENGSGLLATGAIYNLLNHTWQATTATGAPSARTGHSMTYFPSSQSTDRGVLVWGGYGGSYTLTSGGFYETRFPYAWRSTTSSGAPSGRMGHSAVATDHTLIIWGGSSGGYLRRTGGVFNPFNNVWKSTTTSGAPSAREHHTAIWRKQTLASTNGEMIVWGGDDGDITDTGGRYSEPTDFMVSAATMGRTVVPGGTHPDLFRTWVHSLGDFSNPVSLSCSVPALGCVFENNPVTPPQNASTYPDVTLTPLANIAVGTYDFTIDGVSGGVTRRYPFQVVVRDFELSCTEDSIQVQPGGLVQANCSVQSINGFDDEVDLACTSFGCAFSSDPVTPPADGSADFTVSFTAPSTPNTYLEEMAAMSHDALRLFELTVVVTGNQYLFADGFETGSTSEWSGSTE